MTIDDERVITLLRDTVPGVPDVPERVDAIRRRAGRQRVNVWAQTIGGAAAVVLLVGVATAIAAPRPGAVHPVKDPLKRLPAIMAAQTSLAFEATMKPLNPQAQIAGLPAGSGAQIIDSTVTGAMSMDGRARIDGDMSMLALLGPVGEAGDVHLRAIGGTTYRSVFSGEQVPPGKTWVSSPSNDEFGPEQVRAQLAQAAAVVHDTHYVGGGRVRDTDVAKYEGTVPGALYHGDDVTVSFAVDAEGRLRQVGADVDLLKLLGRETNDLPSGTSATAFLVHVSVDVFDYGAPVDVTAPPAAQVATEAQVEAYGSQRIERQQKAWEDCVRAAGGSATARTKCNALLGGDGASETCSGSPTSHTLCFGTPEPGGSCQTATDPDGSVTTTCTAPDGTSKVFKSSQTTGTLRQEVPPSPAP